MLNREPDLLNREHDKKNLQLYSQPDLLNREHDLLNRQLRSELELKHTSAVSST